MTNPQALLSRSKVDAIVVVPPPAEGQTLVTERICTAFDTAFPFKLRAVRNSFGLKGLTWRAFKHILLVVHLIVGAFASLGRRRAYFVPDSNVGLYCNLIEAPILRLGYRDVWLHHHVFRYIRQTDWRMRVILKILGPKVHHIVLGEAMADGLRTHYGAENFHVLGNSIFVEDVPPARRRDTLNTIGFLSNITPEKGIGLFMRTIRRVQETHPEMKCVVAGPISDANLRAEVEAFCAEAPETRKWLGPVYADQKLAFFGEIDLLLFPSQYPNEALPVTICEALAAGAPVLATDRGCIPDQLAGQGWVFGEVNFVDEATSQIANWATDQIGFARASEAAAARYSAQRETDAQSLDRLTDRMQIT
ncbi:MAG: glycosyltransferase family 4 protein [Aliishimia sp.]